MSGAQQNPDDDLQSLAWDDLVALKRRLTSDLKQHSDRLIQIDRKDIHSIQQAIRESRGMLDGTSEKSRHIHEDIRRLNGELLTASERISQSKNFLSLMEARLPAETEEELASLVLSVQAAIEAKQYKNEREKSELLSKSKDATMKIDAIKAIRSVKEQLAADSQAVSKIRDTLNRLSDEDKGLREVIVKSNKELDDLYNSKYAVSGERDSLIADYDRLLKELEAVNLRLDEMSEMRKRQRQEYGYALPTDALFKVKETARKKLEAGDKLSFEELKLLYEDKD